MSVALSPHHLVGLRGLCLPVPEQAGPDAVKLALMAVAKAHNMLLNCGTAAFPTLGMIAVDLKLGGINVSCRHLVLVIDVPCRPESKNRAAKSP